MLWAVLHQQVVSRDCVGCGIYYNDQGWPDSNIQSYKLCLCSPLGELLLSKGCKLELRSLGGANIICNIITSYIYY